MFSFFIHTVGPSDSIVHTKPATRTLIVVASAAIWLAGSMLYRWAAPPTGFAPGIDLIYPPAGLRTLLLIVGGLWAAIGLSIANLMMVPEDLGLNNFASRALFSVYAGVAPYVAMVGSFKLLGLSRGLADLKPRHLPVLCFGIALGSSVLHVIAYCIIGTVEWSHFFAAVAAMALGDFTGCLVVILVVMGILKAFRVSKAI